MRTLKSQGGSGNSVKYNMRGGGGWAGLGGGGGGWGFKKRGNFLFILISMT